MEVAETTLNKIDERAFMADVGDLPKVFEFVQDTLKKIGASEKTLTAYRLSIEEAFVNVASYAYGDKEGKVILEVAQNGEDISVIMIDEGVAFDPINNESPTEESLKGLSADDREIGGLGIFLVKSLMDSVDYQRVGGHNVLSMHKNLHA